jgi:hypothetical protein
MPEKVGFLYSGSQNSLGRQFTKFKNALPGGITLLPTGAADDDYQRKLPDAADRLINVENVKVLVAAGGPVSAFAALRRDGEADGAEDAGRFHVRHRPGRERPLCSPRELNRDRRDDHRDGRGSAAAPARA